MRLTRGMLLSILPGLLLLGGCSPSVESLENATEDMPSVISVEAAENEGDDGIPFAPIPKTVDIVMESDASSSEILAVFDEYSDEIDDGDVESVEVSLEGSKEAVLITGEGIHATASMAKDLVAASENADIAAYQRDAVPVGPGVDIRLEPVEFEQAVGVVGRYRDAEGIEFVQVVAGGFVFIRDEGNGVKGLYDKRENFAQRINRRFGLTGAVITDRSPLELFVSAPGVARVSRFVERFANSQELRRIVIRPRDKAVRRPGT